MNTPPPRSASWAAIPATAPSTPASTPPGTTARTAGPSRSVQVCYALTGLGRELVPRQRAIKQWAETHIEDVRSARAAYDDEAWPVG